jgi:hypothetical protein
MGLGRDETNIIVQLDSFSQLLLAQQVADEVIPGHNKLAIFAGSLCQQQGFFEPVSGKGIFHILRNLPGVVRVHMRQLFLHDALQAFLVLLLGDFRIDRLQDEAPWSIGPFSDCGCY